MIPTLAIYLVLGYMPHQELPWALQTNIQQVDLIDADRYFEDVLASEYTRISCPNDGSCFYHAIAQSLSCEMISVRQTLRAFLEDNHHSLEHLNDDVLSELFLESEFEALLDSVGNTATSQDGRGGLPHAKLAAWAYKVPVVIFSHLFPEAPIVFDTDMEGSLLRGNPVVLIYNGTSHWDRLVPHTDLI
ncbi:MAG: hypothetical protein Q8K75_11480 [Chlamydiales bacterium]|nr:hypothetical protein [Chlamydiales bacterium]